MKRSNFVLAILAVVITGNFIIAISKAICNATVYNDVNFIFQLLGFVALIIYIVMIDNKE